MSRLTVSVVIATKDRPMLLQRAVQSVRRQSRKVEELFIVDDGGGLQSLPAHLLGDGIRIITNEHSRGGAYARNLGASHATGDILMFLDDDDEWEQRKVEAQLEQFERLAACVLVYSGRKIRTDREPNEILRKVCSRKEGNLHPLIFRSNVVGVTSSVAVRKDVFNAVGGFDENLPCRQDYDLWLRACRRGIVMWDGGYNVLYTVFENPLQQVSGRPEKHALAASYILKKYVADIDGLPWYLRRQARAEKWYSVARAYRRSSWLRSAYYCGKALSEAPSVSHVVLLFPAIVLRRLGFQA